MGEAREVRLGWGRDWVWDVENKAWSFKPAKYVLTCFSYAATLTNSLLLLARVIKDLSNYTKASPGPGERSAKANANVKNMNSIEPSQKAEH